MIKKKLLLFDFGAILVGLSKDRCTEALKKIGCGRIAYYVDECRQEDLFHELEVGGSIENFCEEARRQSSYTDEEGVYHRCEATDEEICWAWNQLLTGIPVEKLRMIRRLHDDFGYHTAILSNTNRIHWQYSIAHFFTADGLTVDDYFDSIFLSCDLGMVKPDDCIFREVADALCSDSRFGNLEKCDILFIDDSAKNCEAARSNGIETFCDKYGDLWQSLFTEKVAVIGNFDGVHKGHQYMLGKLKDIAKENGMMPMAITFDHHPRSLFDPDFTPEYLTVQEEKVGLLCKAGVMVQVLPFNQHLADTTARDFMQRILRDELNVSMLLLGYDNRFGKRNDYEDFETYRRYGVEMGIKCVLAEPVDVDGMRVSSSLVRHLVAKGDVADAAKCLGYAYAVTGKVSKGHQEGGKIGFPTANVGAPYGKLLPADGVYVTQTLIDGKPYRSVTNVGMRPTYNNGDDRTVETFVLDFTGDLYGKTITVQFLCRMRGETKFASPEELRRQIEKDVAAAQEYKAEI